MAITRTLQRQKQKELVHCLNIWFITGIIRIAAITILGLLIGTIWLALWIGAANQHYNRVEQLRQEVMIHEAR